MIGRTIGSYRITKLLGEGGMGEVYQATDNIQREVAIKALRPQLTQDSTRLARFRSEAIALGRLNHPNITSLFHLIEEETALYMVMEYVDGHTLDELIRQHGALPPALALDILIDGLHGFEHAHAKGVIHRDIKASNLMVSTEGSTKIMDFGIARMEGGAKITETGRIIGTLPYMSPEQVRGQNLDARSDIYSLGILFFELLTGRVPFMDTNEFDLMTAHLEKAPPPLELLDPSLPSELDQIIAKALAKNPEDRYQNVEEMRAALENTARELSPTQPSVDPGLPRIANPTALTGIQTPIQKPGTLELEDRYGTRLQGSGLPTPPAPPVSELIVTPPTPIAAPAAKRSFPTMLVVGGIALLVIIALAVGMMNRSQKPQTAAHPKTTAKPPIAQIQPTPNRHPEPKRAATKPRVTRIHRVKHRPIPQENPKPRRVVRAAPPKRPAKSSVSENATLRALIKGN